MWQNFLATNGYLYFHQCISLFFLLILTSITCLNEGGEDSDANARRWSDRLSPFALQEEEDGDANARRRSTASMKKWRKGDSFCIPFYVGNVVCWIITLLWIVASKDEYDNSLMIYCSFKNSSAIKKLVNFLLPLCNNKKVIWLFICFYAYSSVYFLPHFWFEIWPEKYWGSGNWQCNSM